jgi:hypothetical protein
MSETSLVFFRSSINSEDFMLFCGAIILMGGGWERVDGESGSTGKDCGRVEGRHGWICSSCHVGWRVGRRRHSRGRGAAMVELEFHIVRIKSPCLRREVHRLLLGWDSVRRAWVPDDDMALLKMFDECMEIVQLQTAA